MFSALVTELIEHLSCLPGVGRKSAQRMALHLLENDRAGARALSQSLLKAMDEVNHCRQCRSFTEAQLCSICDDIKRDQQLLCVVESPTDLMAIEFSGSYQGVYFLLNGHLSPLDGIGPDELGIDQLLARVKQGVSEVILATNPTVEGEATAHFIADLLKPFDLRVSRIAHGVPMGGELEFVDGGTLAHALTSRQTLQSES